MSRNYWAHMLELLKPVHLQPVLCSEKSLQVEARVPQLQSSPHSARKTQGNKKLINFKNGKSQTLRSLSFPI